MNLKDWQLEIMARELSDEDLREEYRMHIIMRNGNTGEHYPEYKEPFDYFNDHPASAEIKK